MKTLLPLAARLAPGRGSEYESVPVRGPGLMIVIQKYFIYRNLHKRKQKTAARVAGVISPHVKLEHLAGSPYRKNPDPIPRGLTGVILLIPGWWWAFRTHLCPCAPPKWHFGAYRREKPGSANWPAWGRHHGASVDLCSFDLFFLSMGSRDL
jgi:hypothetical protein